VSAGNHSARRSEDAAGDADSGLPESGRLRAQDQKQKGEAGDTDGENLVAAMKGLSWQSPRGPMTIDPATRDVIQNVYIRRVERINGKLFNVEFATIENVKDPGAG